MAQSSEGMVQQVVHRLRVLGRRRQHLVAPHLVLLRGSGARGLVQQFGARLTAAVDDVEVAVEVGRVRGVLRTNGVVGVLQHQFHLAAHAHDRLVLQQVLE